MQKSHKRFAIRPSKQSGPPQLGVSDSGAYLLHLVLHSSIDLRIGALGEFRLPAGYYLYVGSARRNLVARLARHRKLAQTKQGKVHWHIDYLLTRPEISLNLAEPFTGAKECPLSWALSKRHDISVPIAGFGASDCKAGCPAHLYRVRPARAGFRLSK